MQSSDRAKIDTKRRTTLARLADQPGRVTFSPVFGAKAPRVKYEVGTRIAGISAGGIGAMLALAKELGLDTALNRHLHLFKLHMPYHESDHVFNIAFNALCGGTCLDDIELRRQDPAFLDALGVDSIPDPTTAGDFCRRFNAEALDDLRLALDEVRQVVWSLQPPAFFDEAMIDADGTIVETTGQCKEGMEYTYNGKWGYHPLVVSLANTQEVLAIYNRPGNRPSHEGAAAFLDDAITLTTRAGFRRITLRGDTDFSQTEHLDRWDDLGNVEFNFGMDAHAKLQDVADALPAGAWETLPRAVSPPPATGPRARPVNVKQPIVVAREFETISTAAEEVASFTYRPVKCGRDYRVVVLRKNLVYAKGVQNLFTMCRYFFWITNSQTKSAAEIVFANNDRCNQENLIGILKSEVHALAAPLNTLHANGASMMIVGLAWTLKVWWSLRLPVANGPWQTKHAAEKQTVVKMKFKRFLQAFMMIPCQIVRSGRQLIYRLLTWNPWQSVFYRMTTALGL